MLVRFRIKFQNVKYTVCLDSGIKVFQAQKLQQLHTIYHIRWDTNRIQLWYWATYEHIKWLICTLNDFLIPPILGLDIETLEEATSSQAKVRSYMMAKAGLEFALWKLWLNFW